MHSQMLRVSSCKCIGLSQEATDFSRRQAMIATVFGSLNVLYNVLLSTAYEWNFASAAGLTIGCTSFLAYAAVLGCRNCVIGPRHSVPTLSRCQWNRSQNSDARSDHITQRFSGLLEDPRFGKGITGHDSSFKLDPMVTVYERSAYA